VSTFEIGHGSERGGHELLGHGSAPLKALGGHGLPHGSLAVEGCD
jgi:hypothetical protein